MRTRVTALEDALARTGEAIAALQEELSQVPPATEIERLNHAFDLIAERAPASEIERLDQTLSHISDVENDQTALRSDLMAIVNEVAEGLLRESVRVDTLLQEARKLIPDSPDDKSVSGFTASLETRFDALYVRFESLYRGSRELILDRLDVYQDLLDLNRLSRLGPAVDLGSGRGEWLEWLTKHGFEAHGVDLNAEITAAAKERGLDVSTEDLVVHLRSLAPRSVSLVSMFHVVEHLTFDVLADVIRAAYLALVPGGAILIETPNPTNLRVGAASFYLDPTHLRPIHPLLLEFLVKESGFESVTTHYLNPDSEPLNIDAKDPDQQRLIQLINDSLLGPLDYAVIAGKTTDVGGLEDQAARIGLPQVGSETEKAGREEARNA